MAENCENQSEIGFASENRLHLRGKLSVCMTKENSEPNANLPVLLSDSRKLFLFYLPVVDAAVLSREVDTYFI